MVTKTKKIGDYKIVLTYTKPTVTNMGKSKIVLYEKERIGKDKGKYRKRKTKEYQTAQTGYQRYEMMNSYKGVGMFQY